MKRLKFLTVVAGLYAAAALSAAAPDFAGKWTASVDQQMISFDFKVDGGKLTGTIENSAAPGPVEIKDGKIEGDKISFHIVRNLNNAETKVLWSGTASGGEIRFTRQTENAAAPGGAATEIVAKRPQ